MKRKRNYNNGKPVTLAQLKQVIAPIYKRFEQIDRRFEQIDQRFNQIDEKFQQIDEQFSQINDQFISLNGKLSAFVGITNMNIRDAEERLEQKFMNKFEEKFSPIMDAVDVFMKRSRDSDREIVLLGKQHDDLAKYCIEKIAYPTYGRNL